MFSKKIMLVICLFIIASTQAQEIDTVIRNDVYTSYYSYQLHEPLYVVYKLYNGGGDCSRKAFHFKTGGLDYSATPKDYKASGFDEGHLADAKDFAYDCEKEEETFRFYNCVPQTPKLNRGIWKHFETVIRKESLNDSLLIICGSIFSDKVIGPDNIAVPDYCWKIVQSLTTHQITYCLIFPNDDSDSYNDINIADLEKLLPYHLTLE